MSPEEVDLVLVATSTPDDLFGSACAVRTSEYGPPVLREHLGVWVLRVVLGGELALPLFLWS